MKTLRSLYNVVSPYLLGTLLLILSIQEIVEHRGSPHFPGFLFSAIATLCIALFSLGVNLPIAKRYLPLWYTIILLPAVAAVFSVAQIHYWNSHPEAHHGSAMAYVLAGIGIATSSFLMSMMLQVHRYIIEVAENEGRTLTEEERFDIRKSVLERFPFGTTVRFRDQNGKVIPPSTATTTSTNQDD